MKVQKSNNTGVDKSVDELNILIQSRLQQRVNKPLVTSPTKPISESTKINEIIKDPTTIVDTGKPLDDNKIIDDFDKVSESDVIDILKPNTIKPLDIPIPVPNKNELDIRDQRRMFFEEQERRRLDDERWDELQQAFRDETERRKAFQKELELMKLEFDLYLKEKYPDIVGEKFIKDTEVEQTKKSLAVEKKKNSDTKQAIKLNMVGRVENEKIRKQKENRLVINKPQPREISTFLEEEIIIEKQEKEYRNPEIKGLNPIQKQIKEVEEMEIRMGRAIIPHRDFVESEESDFDSNSMTKSTDILIKPNNRVPFENYEDKRDSLEQLRKSLGGGKTDDDLAVKLDNEDRQKNRQIGR